MTPVPEYFERYECALLERDAAGVLTVRLATAGGTLAWSGVPHRDLPRLFEDIGNDPDNALVILTGTGDAFIGELDFGSRHLSARYAARLNREARRMLFGLLEIDVPLIGAINGPVRVHSELAVLCDIVVATPATVFQDAPHYPAGLIPGDGVHVVWPALLGPNRGRYFLLMGEEIDAAEALRLGVIQEIVEPSRLMDRAHEIATQILRAPAHVSRFSSTAIRAQIRTLLHRDLELGLAIEGMFALGSWPTGVVGAPNPSGEPAPTAEFESPPS